MAANNGSGINIKVEEVDVEIMKTETEVFGESWVHHCVDVKELLQNENGNLEYSAEQNKNSVLDTTIKTISTCRTPKMADNNNNGTNLNLLNFPIKEEYSPTNIKVEEVNSEIIKTETEVSGGLREMIGNENEKRNLENYGDQLLNTNLVIKKEAFEDDSRIYERINNLSANRQKGEEKLSQGDLIENVEISNQEEKEKFKLNCSCRVVQESQLLSHIKSHQLMEKSYYCSKCSYAAVQKCDLLLHIKSRHTVEKPYKCKECSYAAVCTSNLVSHIKFRHAKEKPYKCNDCSYTAVQKKQLLFHIQSHHTLEKPHKCNECSYAAVRKSNLIAHVKHYHTREEKPYNCSECSYTAAQKANLLYHIKSRHVLEKPYKCNECSYSAVHKNNLVCHIKSRHTMHKRL